MFVDTGLLHSGANEAHCAGGHAQDGADDMDERNAAKLRTVRCNSDT
jgi:Protein of unknown function (DUF2563)